MNKEEYYLVTQTSRDGSTRAMLDCEGTSGMARLLRPTRQTPKDLKKEEDSKNGEGTRINIDPGTSAIKKRENAGVELSSRAKRALSAFDRDAEYQRSYSKRSEVVKQKLIQHSYKIQEHLEYKRTHSVKSDYRKGQLDPSSSAPNDHAYSRK